MLGRKKIVLLLIVFIAVAGGASLGFFLGKNSSNECYQVPVKNTCGPEALCAALAQFNISVVPEKVAQLAQTDAQGTTMLGLKQAAESLGVKAVGMRLSQKQMESYIAQGAGVIAFVNGDHYVWVKQVHAKGMVIKDSAPGFQFVPLPKWQTMWFQKSCWFPIKSENGKGLCLIVIPQNK